MSAALARRAEDPQVRLARTASLLRQSVRGSRLLDAMVAEAFGWQSKVVDGERWWRRFRVTWSKQTPLTVPPRYTAHLELLMAELPRSATLSLRVDGSGAEARIALAVPIGEPGEVHVALGETPELALAGALVAARWQEPAESAFAALGGRP